MYDVINVYYECINNLNFSACNRICSTTIERTSIPDTFLVFLGKKEGKMDLSMLECCRGMLRIILVIVNAFVAVSLWKTHESRALSVRVSHVLVA